MGVFKGVLSLESEIEYIVGSGGQSYSYKVTPLRN
jgi:hypothetical protein